jgi:hypothetical protein
MQSQWLHTIRGRKEVVNEAAVNQGRFPLSSKEVTNAKQDQEHAL